MPLVFLEACQTAHAEEMPTASVAARLLQQGVASVVAMSHSVLVETARRFVTQFSRELLSGAHIGQAMLAGQHALQQDSYHSKSFTEELRLQDWFVPVLFQAEADSPLLAEAEVAHVQEALAQQRRMALGERSDPPVHYAWAAAGSCGPQSDCCVSRSARQPGRTVGRAMRWCGAKAVSVKPSWRRIWREGWCAVGALTGRRSSMWKSTAMPGQCCLPLVRSLSPTTWRRAAVSTIGACN